jgi:shikimate dehydrogenase
MSRFVLIGHPVGHSLSPVIHRAAYRALGLPHEYALVDAVDETAVRGIVDELRRGRIAGANVTVPYKRLALELADRAHPLAASTGAANVLAREGSQVVAYNTDVLALADELGERAAGARVAAVIGNGGAALAAVAACRSVGVGSVGVVARAWRAAESPAGWSRAAEFRKAGATVLPWPAEPVPARAGSAGDAWDTLVCSSQIIVQATSAGMLGVGNGGSVRDIVPWPRLAAGTLAFDVVYNPPVTAFLEAANAAGVRAEGGLGMLVGQAARALSLWLGVEPPRGSMREAAEQALEAPR